MAGQSGLRLHALWQNPSSFYLWVEKLDGHKILPDIDYSALSVSDRQIFAVLQRGSKTVVNAVLQTPKGRRVEQSIPAFVFMPANAVRVLTELSEFRESTALASDTKFFVDVVSALDSFARSGRAYLSLLWEEGQWWPRWKMPEGLTETAWQSQVAQRTPPVLLVNGGPTVAADFVSSIYHWVVTALLKDIEGADDRHQSFVQALLDSQPLNRVGPAVASGLAKWRASALVEDVSLLFAIEEPAYSDDDIGLKTELDIAGLLDVSAEKGESNSARYKSETLWPLRMYFRAGVAAPERLNPEMCRRSILQMLRPQLQKAQEAFPPFLHAQPGGYGLDLLLTSQQVVDLVSDGIEKLAEVGIDVMVPTNWTVGEPKLTLRTGPVIAEPTEPAGRSNEPKLGFDQLVQYEWKLAIGGIELNESELRELAASGSGLVRLRDHWVHADPEAAREALKFLVEQTKAGEEIGEGVASLKELHFPGGAESQAPVEVNPLSHGWLSGVIGSSLFWEEFDKAGGDIVEMNQRRQKGPQPSPGLGSETEKSLAGDDVTDLFRVPVPAGFTGQLRGYQQRGLEWLSRMSDNGFGVILADDMGLGKTIQILSLLQHEKELERVTKPSLLVVPTGVLRNWVNEAERFTPELSIGMLHGAHRPKDQELVEYCNSHDLIVTTYGIATREQAQLNQLEWEHVIADEAQAIKNPNSQASRALRSFDGRQNIAMTGTPVENDLGELRSIMDFCNPRMLGSAGAFRRRFAIPIERDNDETVLAQLRALTAPFILRRMKTDPAIALDLPRKNESIESVTLTAEQAMLYESAVKDLERKLHELKLNKSNSFTRRGIILSGITKLKQICNHPAQYQHDGSSLLYRGQHRSGKLVRLDQLLRDIVERDERALIFTQFVSFGDMLVPYLEKRYGTAVPFITGALTPGQREKLVSEFNAPSGPPIMLLSTLAAGVGINLTAANHVIHLDRWWNPAVENQATDRAYRIGQRKDVHVHKLVCVGTLEERIDELIFEKSVLADSVVKTGETKLTELQFEQLHSLWRLDKQRLAKQQEQAGTTDFLEQCAEVEGDES